MVDGLDKATTSKEDTPGPVVFHVVGNNRYSLQINPERPYFDDGGRAHIIPAKIVTFENCVYEASNPEEIRLIRASKAYRRKDIFELKEGEKPEEKAQQAKRGVVDTNVLNEEAGVPQTEEQAITLRESAHACDHEGCTASFDNKKSLHMHKMGKHRIRKKVASRK